MAKPQLEVFTSESHVKTMAWSGHRKAEAVLVDGRLSHLDVRASGFDFDVADRLTTSDEQFVRNLHAILSDVVAQLKD